MPAGTMVKKKKKDRSKSIVYLTLLYTTSNITYSKSKYHIYFFANLFISVFRERCINMCCWFVYRLRSKLKYQSWKTRTKQKTPEFLLCVSCCNIFFEFAQIKKTLKSSLSSKIDVTILCMQLVKVAIECRKL